MITAPQAAPPTHLNLSTAPQVPAFAKDDFSELAKAHRLSEIRQKDLAEQVDHWLMGEEYDLDRLTRSLREHMASAVDHALEVCRIVALVHAKEGRQVWLGWLKPLGIEEDSGYRYIERARKLLTKGHRTRHELGFSPGDALEVLFDVDQEDVDKLQAGKEATEILPEDLDRLPRRGLLRRLENKDKRTFELEKELKETKGQNKDLKVELGEALIRFKDGKAIANRLTKLEAQLVDLGEAIESEVNGTNETFGDAIPHFIKAALAGLAETARFQTNWMERYIAETVPPSASGYEPPMQDTPTGRAQAPRTREVILDYNICEELFTDWKEIAQTALGEEFDFFKHPAGEKIRTMRQLSLPNWARVPAQMVGFGWWIEGMGPGLFARAVEAALPPVRRGSPPPQPSMDGVIPMRRPRD